MFERFDNSARRAVVLAQEEARSLNHNYVGTEHLLLALTIDRGLAGQALNELGVTHDKVRDHILELIGAGTVPVNGHIAFTAQSRDVLLLAVRAALTASDDRVHPGHVLTSLLAHDRSSVPVAAVTIVQCGASAETIREHLAALTATIETADGPEPIFTLSA
ncbi:Clp protease N-terminal domain-containing protein [Arthrobacter sp. UYCo732]|uniref:Clp protease N-terminal domain-containing protein n=1 Tax=Arthrobacter sp. UYCo732 TaxID=3156336 RepID=UPI00339AF4EA